MKRKFLQGLGGFLCVLLVLSGCVPVNGVDVGKALQNSLEAASYEGSATIKLQVEADAAEARPDYSILNGVTLQLKQIRAQDKEHFSANGEIEYSKGSIPLRLYKDKDKVYLQLAGAEKPVALEADIGRMIKLPFDVSAFGNQSSLIHTALPLLVKYFPNPGTVTVEDVNETVQNESLRLKKIHTEISGPELAGLISQTLAAAVADKAGLTAIITEVLNKMGAAEKAGPLAGLVQSGAASGFVYEAITTALPDLNAGMQKQLGPLFDAGSSLTLDLYVDGGSLQLRKGSFRLAAAGAKDSGLKSLKVSGTFELWNVNQPVTADVIPAAGAVDLGTDGKMPRFLKNLNPQSQLYRVLMDDMHVTRKTINLPMPAGVNETTAINGEAFIKNEKTLVPVRFVSEQLGADVLWHNDTRQVQITDILSGKQIWLTLDSKTAVVNGENMELEVPAQLTYEKTYVPVRFIAENFGAEVDWNNDTRTVIIVRK